MQRVITTPALGEVLGVPVENARYLERSGTGVETIAAAVAEKAACAILELMIEFFGNEGVIS